jgi:hypothetical protein
MDFEGIHSLIWYLLFPDLLEFPGKIAPNNLQLP